MPALGRQAISDGTPEEVYIAWVRAAWRATERVKME